MLALPCCSADEALSLSSQARPWGRALQDQSRHTQLRLRALLPGDLHPAGAGSPPVGWHSPCSWEHGGPSAPPPSHTMQELQQQQRQRDRGLFLVIRG